MLYGRQFSEDQWQAAPVYDGTIAAGRVIGLDFEILADLAEDQSQKGKFTVDRTSKILSMAPLIVKGFQAAFYRLVSETEDREAELQTTDDKTIVVIDGVLRVTRDPYFTKPELRGTKPVNVIPGAVITSSDETLSMQPISVFSPRRCIALAIYGNPEIVIADPTRPLPGIL